jgi:hypothetical protein
LREGNSRRQSLYPIHLRTRQLRQKLPDIRAQALYITAKSLRINRIKSEATFARAAPSAKDDKFMPGKGKRDIFEVILAGTDDPNRVGKHYRE